MCCPEDFTAAISVQSREKGSNEDAGAFKTMYFDVFLHRKDVYCNTLIYEDLFQHSFYLCINKVEVVGPLRGFLLS